MKTLRNLWQWMSNPKVSAFEERAVMTLGRMAMIIFIIIWIVAMVVVLRR